MKFQKLWLFWQVFDDEVLRNISQQFISLVYGNSFSLTPTGVILKNFMNFSFNFCEIWGNLTQDLRLKNHPRSSGLKIKNKKKAAAWEFHIELGGHVEWMMKRNINKRKK